MTTVDPPTKTQNRTNRRRDGSIISGLVVASWIAAALYVGIGGYEAANTLQKAIPPGSSGNVEYDGLSFQDEESLREFLQERTSARSFPWIYSIPQDLILLVAGLAFGTLGGTIRILHSVVVGYQPLKNQPFITGPIFGALIGLMLFFLSFLAPAVFTSGKTPPRIEALLGLSLFGGIFCEQTYAWIERTVVKLFKR